MGCISLLTWTHLGYTIAVGYFELIHKDLLTCYLRRMLLSDLSQKPKAWYYITYVYVMYTYPNVSELSVKYICLIAVEAYTVHIST